MTRLYHAETVVLLDGHDNQSLISDALMSRTFLSAATRVHHVRDESKIIVVTKEIRNLTMPGDGIDATVISGSRSNPDGPGTV